MGKSEATFKEAEEYFWKQMENGNIINDYQQIIFEKAIEALRIVQKDNKQSE